MIKNFIILTIKLYRKYLSPFKLQSCRFYPTCSGYALECFQKFGTFKGILKSTKRILKCHPFHPGGHDPIE